VEQGRLACARSAHDADDFALGDVEVDAFQHFETAVGFMDACRLNHTDLIWRQRYGLFFNSIKMNFLVVQFDSIP